MRACSTRSRSTRKRKKAEGTAVKHIGLTRLVCALAPLMAAGPALAQPAETNWPSKPIRLIAPFPPASTADVIGRVFGQKMSQRLGQPVLVDNRVGASGNLGADAIAKAAPDGYTIGIVTWSTHAVAVSLSSKLPYDPLKDFTPITMLANSPYV